jgi:hypothetical protein
MTLIPADKTVAELAWANFGSLIASPNLLLIAPFDPVAFVGILHGLRTDARREDTQLCAWVVSSMPGGAFAQA